MNSLMKTVHPLDISIVAGRGGATVVDDQGREYLDFWGDEGVNSLGYGADEVAEVLFNHLQSRYPLHVPKMFREPLREEFANQLALRTGLADAKVFFSNSGTEANEAAIKLARRYWAAQKGEPERYHIATLAGNFHGRTGFSLASSDSSESPYHKLGFGPMPVGFHVWEDFADLERLAKTPGGLAAVMMATVLGNNVIIDYPQEFWDKLVEFRKRTGVLIVLDEVQVSMGRTGKFMAYQHYGFTPDIVSIGKGIAAGLPLAATVATGEVANAFVPGVHFNTFGGNALAARMALRVLSYLDVNMERSAALGQYARGQLRQMPFMDYVNGMGIHNCFRPKFEQFGYNGIEFCEEAANHGLLICTHRPFGIIRFTPPLAVSQKEMDAALDAIIKTHNALVAKKQ